MDPVSSALESFLSQLDDLTAELGDDQVLSALEVMLPGFDKDVYSPREALETLMEESKSIEGKTVKAVRDFLTDKGVSGATDKGTLTKLGIGTGVGGVGGALANLTGKEWDQDVNIANVTTDKALPVSSDSLEQALADTRDAIEKMNQTLTQTQQQLAGKLDSIDMSVDDTIAAETGETRSDIQTRQSYGLRRPETEKTTDKKELDKEKEKPKKQASVPA